MKEKKGKAITPGETKEPLRSARRRKKYVKPEIISCSAEDLIEQLGSARACTFGYSVVTCGRQYDSDDVN